MGKTRTNKTCQKRCLECYKTIGLFMRESWMAAIAELSLAVLFVALAVFRKIPTPTIPLLFLGWLSLWVRQEGWRKIGLSSLVRWKTTIILAVVTGSLYQLADILIIVPLMQSISGRPIELSQLEPLRNNIPLYLTGLILSWTLAAFGEEMVFRGYLLNRVANLLQNSNLGWVLALGVTSSLFGLGHLSQGITGILDNILLGAFLAILYLASRRNLWLPILTHGIIDTIGFTLIFIGYYP